ncbi:MAG: hypothetical protein WC716_16485 [Chitinophagaceae bacterium]
MLNLKTGDCFCTRNPMFLGRIISAIELFWSTDGHAEYSHAGMMLNNTQTFESLLTNKSQDFYQGYQGENVLVVRPQVPDLDKFLALQKIYKEHNGKWYPFHRLPMFIFPPLAKINIADRPVCSEMTAKYLTLLKIRQNWKGVNPDTLADEFRNWKQYEIIYEGVL